MDARPFLDQLNKPTEAALQVSLGRSYPWYLEIITLADGYSKEWGYTKGSGWMLKVFDARKALFYLIPLKDEFRISLAIRENEQKVLLQDDELSDLRMKISSAKKYAEGYALQFNIANNIDFLSVGPFIKKLIAIRG